ncbi:hypothetical protein C8Q77DRAFT_159404 [Trametes polyzona]|nr:hypothetical protein C8Q77DRAFT_159404 [Trametes polyzona]
MTSVGDPCAPPTLAMSAAVSSTWPISSNSPCIARTNQCLASGCQDGELGLTDAVLHHTPCHVQSQCGDGVGRLSAGTSPARSRRVSPCAVSVEYRPLEERLLERPDDLIDMVSQITDVLHALCYEAKIVYGSVSYSNIVWNPGPDGRARFFLVDFEDSVATDVRQPATGRPHRCFIDTLAFMSVGLLDAGPGSHSALDHQLYHDYESLFWVSLWAAMKTETVPDPLLNGKIRKAVREWETGEPATIANRKEHILRLKTLDIVPLTPRFEKPTGYAHPGGSPATKWHPKTQKH